MLTWGQGAHSGCEWELRMPGAPAWIGKIGGGGGARASPSLCFLAAATVWAAASCLAVLPSPPWWNACAQTEPVLLLRHLATATRQWLVQRLTNSAKRKQQIVSKLWRNWRARVPWAGTQNYADAMVNRIEITHKTENRITCDLAVSCLGMQTKGWRVKSWRDTHTYSCSIHNSKNK